MQLWPVLLWPKPKARQHIHINLQFARRSSKYKILHIFIINALLQLITITATGAMGAIGSTTSIQQHQKQHQNQHHQQQHQQGNYEGVDAVAALTGLSNGYASPNYIKNYYQLTAAEATELEQQQQQQQHQLQHNNILDRVKQLDASVAERGSSSGGVGGGSIIGHGILGLQSNNYGNSIATRGGGNGGGVGEGSGGGVVVEEEVFNVHESGFMPTTFTAAGQHYATSLIGLQAIPDNSNNNNAQPYTTATTSAITSTNTATNKIDFEQQLQQQRQQQYGNAAITVVDNKAHQHHHNLFGRLSNYGDLTVDADNNDDRRNLHGRAGGGGGGIGDDIALQNYALAYADDADDAQQSSVIRENMYNEHNNNNIHIVGGDEQQQQNFVNYFTPSSSLTATHDIENQQKYYTLNNYPQIDESHYQQQHQQQRQQRQEYKREHEQQQHLYKTYKLHDLATTQAPATYYETYYDNNEHDNKEQHHQHPSEMILSNYQTWNLEQQQENQIPANYHTKQLVQQEQQQLQQQQQPQQLEKLLQEPETSETSYSSKHYTKPYRNKSKRSDEDSYSYQSLDSEDSTPITHQIQLQELQHLREQIHQQQQKFIELQHQLIDHDQQLQIHKHHVEQQQQQQPTLPPITHTVHHNQHSLAAISGIPLTKHTQVIKSIPVHQHRQIHVPYRKDVEINIPDTVIKTSKTPTPIEIPVTKTITIPKIEEVKIPIEKVHPYPVERPIPYLVEKRVPYAVEKQIAKPIYYPVPIKVPIVHTVVHKVHAPQPPPHPHHGHYHQNYSPNNYHQPPHHYRSHRLPHSVYKRGNSLGHHSYGHSHYGGNYLK